MQTGFYRESRRERGHLENVSLVLRETLKMNNEEIGLRFGLD